MKKRIVRLGAVLCASALLFAGGAAAEERLGDYIYVPAMTVAAQAGQYSLRVEGVALEAGGDEPVYVEQLSGAEFGVYVISGSGELTPWANPLYPSEPMRIRTVDGETRFALPQGTEFFLRQESAPAGYTFDAETLIQVTDGEIVVRNAMAGELLIRAVDSLGQPVAGVSFGVTAADGTTEILTADESGEAVLASASAGAYWVYEAALPEDVLSAVGVAAARESDVLGQQGLELNVQVSEATRTRVTFTHPASGAVQLSMQLAVLGDDGETVMEPLSGVMMEIFGQTSMTLTTDAQGQAQASLLEGEYTVRLSYDGDAVLPVTEGRMIVESGATTVIELCAAQTTGRVALQAVSTKEIRGGSMSLRSVETGEIFGPYALDSAGEAVSEALLPGNYEVTLEAPQDTEVGVLTCAEISAQQALTVEIASGVLTQVEAELLTREKQTFEVLMSAVDEAGELQLTRLEETLPVTLCDGQGNAVSELMAQDGYVSVEALSGTYTLRLDDSRAQQLGVQAQSAVFTLPADGETIAFTSVYGRLILASVDENGTPISGASYQITDSAGQSNVVRLEADSELVTMQLPAGTTVIETEIAPEGYDGSAVVTVEAVPGAALRVQIMHERYGTAQFVINERMLDERGETTLAPLADAQVTLMRVDAQGQTKQIDELTSGEDGRVAVQLAPGEYVARLEETEGLSRTDGEVRFTVENTQQTDVQLYGYDALGGVWVTLVGGELSDEELAQARFVLIAPDDSEVSLALTDDGYYVGGLEEGTYTLRQTQMPEGYTLGADRIVEVAGGEAAHVNVPLEEYAVLSVSKTGLTFNDQMQTYVVPLTGEYGIYVLEDGEMKPYPSQEAQMTIWSNVTPEQIAEGRMAQLRLPAALEGTTYYLRELTDAQGFEADSVYHELTLHAGEQQTLTCAVSSDRGFFTAEQLDAATGVHVSGGSYELLDAQTQETVLTFVMGETAYRNEMAVPVGEYVLRQTQAAPGYAMNTPAECMLTITPYLTQGGSQTVVTLTGAQIPQSATMDMIADIYAADEQGLTLLSVDGGTMAAGETLILPQLTLYVDAADGQRVDVESVQLDGACDAQGSVYVARVEYCLRDGGWQPSDAKLTGELTSPAVVSLSDVKGDICAVRVTYLLAQTGEEAALGGFTPGRVTLDVRPDAEGTTQVSARAAFTGTYVYTTRLYGEQQLLARESIAQFDFAAQGNGTFAAVPAGQDGRISGVAFLDENADGVLSATETGRYAGMTVSLLTAAGETVDSCRTDAQGRYAFSGISSGVYTVEFDAGESVVFSHGTLYSEQVSSGVADPRYGLSETLTVDGNHTDYVVNAGCLYAARLDGVIWEHTAEDEIQGFGGLSVEMRAVNAGDEEEPFVILTDDLGCFELTGILPGEYEVRIELPEGYLCDEAVNGCITERFTFAQGDVLSFGESVAERAASLSGYVCVDDDGDGTLSDDAEALSGVKVTLMRVSDGHTAKAAETVTGADGAYAFTQLPSGTYCVLFELPEGWTFTRYGGDSLVYGAAAGSGSTPNLTLNPGQNREHVDAGVTIPAQLTVAVFKDEQYDGQKGVYEAMLDGVQITLIRQEDGEDGLQVTSVTDADGLAVFENVSPGEYVLAYQMPGAWRATKQVDPETTRYPVSCVPQSALSVGRSESFDLKMGEDCALYIGAMLSGTISGTVYYDDDADAVLGETETACAGILVELLDAQGETLAQTASDEAGAYAFEGLAPGRYFIRFTAPDGCGFSGTERTMARGGVQVSDDPVSTTRVIAVTSGSATTSADAGIVRLSRLSGLIWEDRNADCDQDETETGLGGVEVALMNGSGRSILLSTTTDENGAFAFEDLRPGDYLLRVSAPDGYVFSGALTSGALPISETRDGRAYSSAFTLLGGAEVDRIGFGLLTLGSISGRVWRDVDYDGLLDEEESGLRGVVLTLLDASGEETARTTTLRTGEYAFDGLMPGEYTLVATLTDGYVFTADGGDSRAARSDSQTAQIELGALSMGESIENVNIGALQPASIGGTVWYDADNDGKRQVNDKGMTASVTLTALEGTDAGRSWQVETDETGAYRVDGVMPGTYQLSFVLPEGYAFAKNVSGTKRVSCVPQTDAVSAESAAFAVVTGVNALDLDVGAVGVGTVSGTVWEDSAYDGLRGSAENGVAGAVIELLDAASGETLAGAETDENGVYAIDFVRVGTYILRVSLPGGRIFTCEGDSVIAPSDVSVGESESFALAMGESRAELDIGAIVPASLSGVLYIDENENGQPEDGEAGLPGAMITLMQGGTVVATVNTDSTGAYALSTLRPGTYRLRVTLPEATLFAEGTSLTLEEADASEGETASFTLSMGDSAQIAPLGTVKASVIAGRAWSDEDADGRIGEEESSLTDTLVELLAFNADGTGSIVASIVVDEEGTYAFERLRSGTYAVRFTLPNGMLLADCLEEAGDDVSSVPVTAGNVGMTEPFALAMGETRGAVNVGGILPGEIGDSVWLDVNGNGLQDFKEPAVSGVAITLMRMERDGSIIEMASTVSDSYGYYHFRDLRPGTYIVRVQLGERDTLTYHFGEPLGQIDSDIDPDSGESEPIVLRSGEARLDVDIGFTERE